MRCEICGGASTCPGDITVRPAAVDHWHYGGRYCDRTPRPCPGYESGGRGPRHAVLAPAPEGWRLLIVGAAQEQRIAAHTGMHGTWVEMCHYAYYVREEGS